MRKDKEANRKMRQDMNQQFSEQEIPMGYQILTKWLLSFITLKMQIQMSRKYIFTISDGQRSNNLLIVAAGKEEKPALSPTVGGG